MESSNKNILDFLINKFKGIMDLSPFYSKINELISTEYNKGLIDAESETSSKINFVPKENDLKFLQNYVDENTQAFSDDMAGNLRQEIQRSIMNKDDIKTLTERIKLVFKEKKYLHRLKTIFRTESSRANNQGRLEGAKQAEEVGLKLKKWISIIKDSRTSNICLKENSKYGDPDKAIPIDDNFIIEVDNKTIKSQSPPFHPNCRSVLRLEVIE